MDCASGCEFVQYPSSLLIVRLFRTIAGLEENDVGGPELVGGGMMPTGTHAVTRSDWKRFIGI